MTGSAATVRLDVAGWYGDAQLTTGGSLFHPVAPALVRSASRSSSRAGHRRGRRRPGRSARRRRHLGDPRGRGPRRERRRLARGAAGRCERGHDRRRSRSATGDDGRGAGDGAAGRRQGAAAPVGAAPRRSTVRALGYTTDRARPAAAISSSPARRWSTRSAVLAAHARRRWRGSAGVSRYGAEAYLLAVHAGTRARRSRCSVGSAAAGAEQVPTVSVRAAGARCVRRGRRDRGQQRRDLVRDDQGHGARAGRPAGVVRRLSSGDDMTAWSFLSGTRSVTVG